MTTKERANRIAHRIKEELSKLLLFEVTDPRLHGVYITNVHVDKELAYANIFFSSLEGSERKDEILEGFDHAKGFLRYQLSQLIQLRSFPRLRFKWDPAPEHVDRIDQLIQSLKEDNHGEASEDE
jgi:ribosome-binding factor A